MTPTVALITLINCSGKLCSGYLTMLKTPSITSHIPRTIRSTEITFKIPSPLDLFFKADVHSMIGFNQVNSFGLLVLGRNIPLGN